MKIVRKLSTLLLICCFIYMAICLLGMEVAPDGKELSTGFLAFNEHTFKKIHETLGYIFGVLAIIHVLLNYKTIITHLKKMRNSLRPSFTAIAAIIVSTAVFATIALSAAQNTKHHYDKKYKYHDDITEVSEK